MTATAKPAPIVKGRGYGQTVVMSIRVSVADHDYIARLSKRAKTTPSNLARTLVEDRISQLRNAESRKRSAAAKAKREAADGS